MEIAHLLNFAVMVPNPRVQLFHKALVSIWLVIVNRPEKTERKENEGREQRRVTRISKVEERKKINVFFLNLTCLMLLL